MLKPSLLFKKQCINNWFDAGIDKPLKDLLGDTEQTYQSITLWVPHWLHQLWNQNYKQYFPNLGNFKSAQTAKSHVTRTSRQLQHGL